MNRVQGSATRHQVLILLLGLFIGLVCAGVVVSKHFTATWFAPVSSVGIYGYWQEHDVAAYAADSFEVRPQGIFHDGRLVTLHYEWDGEILHYQRGGEHYIYRYINNSLVRQQPAHYISTFLRHTLPQS